MNEQVLSVERLPGGAHPQDISELLAQIDVAAGAELQRQLGPSDWAKYSEQAERHWEAAPLPIVVHSWSSNERPDVVARFTALAITTKEPCLVSGFVRLTDDKKLALVQVTVELALPGGGVNSETMRSIHWSEILAAVEYLIQTRPQWLELVAHLGLAKPTDELRASSRETAAAIESVTPQKPGRPRRSDDLYRWVALNYLQLQEQGFGRGILDELATKASIREKSIVPRDTVRAWVRSCRKYGWLEGGTQGRAGARPGPRLREWHAPKTFDP